MQLLQSVKGLLALGRRSVDADLVDLHILIRLVSDLHKFRQLTNEVGETFDLFVALPCLMNVLLDILLVYFQVLSKPRQRLFAFFVNRCILFKFGFDWVGNWCFILLFLLVCSRR